jgi:hypothetical protein
MVQKGTPLFVGFVARYRAAFQFDGHFKPCYMIEEYVTFVIG